MSPARPGFVLVLTTVFYSTMTQRPLKVEESLNAVSGDSTVSRNSSSPVSYWWTGPNIPFVVAFAEFEKCTASKGADCGAWSLQQPETNHSAGTDIPNIPSPNDDEPESPDLPHNKRKGQICRGPKHTCVIKSLCINGIAKITDANIRQNVHRCKPSKEVCCEFQIQSKKSKTPLSFTTRPFASSYAPKTTVQEYEEDGRISASFFRKSRGGCAAALICIPEDFCTSEGVASESKVSLTKKQSGNKVPLTSCRDRERGIVGKCCRDPTYEDPWPVGQLGLWNPPNDTDDGSYKYNHTTVLTDSLLTSPEPRIKTTTTTVTPPPTTGGDYMAKPRINLPLKESPPSTETSQHKITETKLIQNKYKPVSSEELTCGTRKPGNRPRGYMSLDTDFGEISWQAMILRVANRSLLCGGAIIKSNAVLTAAHCVDGLQENDVEIKAGEWRLGTDEEPQPFQIVKVDKITHHPRYEPGKLINDVAVLHLTEDLRLDNHIEPICLPTEAEVETIRTGGAICITSGWGKEVLKIHIANSVMHKMDVKIMTGDQCRKVLESQYPSDVSKLDTNTCTCCTPADPSQDICDTDPGSALACDLGDGYYKLNGVYSWDTGCGPSSQPEGKQQIASFAKLDVEWINSQLGTIDETVILNHKFIEKT